jgi:hypothetical protein
MSDNPSANGVACKHDKRAEGQCRKCRRCLECRGRPNVTGSCAAKWAAMTPIQQSRSVQGYDGYWRSYEAGRQKR